MKFSSIFTAVCVGLPALSAAAYIKSPGEVIVGSIRKIDTAVKNLDVAILGANDPNNLDLNGLLGNASFLFDTLNNQSIVANATGKLDNKCADYVQTYIAKLIKSVRKLAKDTISKKPVFVAAFLDQALVIILGQEKEATDAFADVLISKVYKPRLALAKKDKADVDAAIQSIIDAYNTTPS